MVLIVKICPRCKTEKPAHDYYADTSKSNGLQSICKECSKRKSRRYYSDNRPARRVYHQIISKPKRRLNRYTLSPEAYDELFISQEGSCAICKKKDVNLSIDHDHDCCGYGYSCGFCIRGLLCNRCNLGLGGLQDSLNVILNAADYLMSYQNNIKNRLH